MARRSRSACAERVAGEDLRGLHHLFLVDDDAVGLAQDRLELGMDVVRLLRRRACARNRSGCSPSGRPVERDQRDDVLEAVGLHVEQRARACPDFPAGRRRPLRRATAARRSSCRRAGSPRDRARCRAASSSSHRGLQHRQRLQAEEVELHQARLLDPFHVELGDRHVGLRIAVERHQLRQRPVADHDAGGVRRGVAVEPFELQRDVEGALDDRLARRARPAAAARPRSPWPASPDRPGSAAPACRACRPGRRASPARGRRRAARRAPAACRR